MQKAGENLMKHKGIVLIIYIFALLCLVKIDSFAQQVTADAKDEEQMLQNFYENVSVKEHAEDESLLKKTVRVAWYERDGLFEIGKDGKIYGFGIDYLNAISEYTGWEYEFMKGTRAQCIDYVETGLADIMFPVNVEEDFTNAKLIREIIGEDYGYIYKAANNLQLNFEDVQSFKKVTLGVERRSGLLSDLKRYCESNKIKFYDIVMYDTLDEMRKDLSDGKIDAFVADSFVQLDNLKVVGKFSSHPVTVVTNGDYIWENLNDATERIKVENPNFFIDLKGKYFEEGSKNSIEYTKEERVFLSMHHTYKVALSSEQYPISYRGNQAGEYKGITKDVLNKIKNQTGVEFKIVYADSYEEAEQMLKEKEVDILGGTIVSSQESAVSNNSRQEGEHHKEYTDTYYSMKMAIVGEKNTAVDEALTVAIPAYFKQEIASLQEMYGAYEFVVYGSDTECVDAILSGAVDVAIQPELKINEIIIYEKYKSLQNLKYVPGNYETTFRVRSDDELLVSILNKAIGSISESSMSTIVNNNMQHIAVRGMTVLDFWRVYKGYIVLGLVATVVAGSALILYQRYKREEADKEKAYRDSITNLSSMEKFRIDVKPVLDSKEKTKYYIITADIDKFKVINALYGYHNGDRVLEYIARMLKQGLTVGDFITRNSADNFVVLKRAESEAEVSRYLTDVYKRVNEKTSHQENNYLILLKAGICQVVAEDNNLSSIMDRAIMAKKTIGQIHTSMHAFYSDNMRQRAIEEKNLENEMELALERHQFCIFLQPQIDLDTKKIVSAEALVRWKHPEKGMIPPFKFIPVFENNGFITKLDLFVWEEAIKTLVKWRENNQIMVPIAINLSRADVEKDGVMESLINLMEKYQLGTQWIKTELTESMCSDEDSVVLNRMQMLRDYGFKIAVDDFGSGYSSLHLLKKMPIDILKIDKSFLDINIDMDIRDEIVIRDVVDMGKHLELQIIVEGVETQEQSDFLEMLGCDIAQGYYYGKPVPIDEFETMLKENHEGGK